MDKVSIIIPAYNEGKRIEKTLESYSKYLEDKSSKKIIDYEIVVVINNTKDNTEEIVKKATKKNKKISYLNLVKGGKGYAVIEGFKNALERDNNLIGFVDADMATSPEEYWKLIGYLSKTEIGGVISSRYMRDSSINPKPTIQRKIAKRAFNSVVRSILFLPYKDTQCGAKLFRKEVVEAILKDLTMSQWAFDVDLLYTIRKRKFKVKELPTIWIDKEYSTINFWKSGPWMVLGVIRLRLINSPFKSLLRIYDKLISKMKK